MTGILTKMSSDGVSQILETLSSAVAPALISALEEASQARNLVKGGEATDGPSDLHDQLLHNRRQIERLEHLTGQFLLLKARSAQQVASRKGAYDDAYMAAATKKAVGFTDYTSAKEKDAHYNLATLAETLELRKANALYRDVESAWDFCRILLRGAEGVQRDLELRLRIISLNSSLER